MDPCTTPLRLYRKDNKITLTELSERVGVTPSQLSRIERFGTPLLGRARTLAEITGLPVEAFGPREAVG